MIKLLIADDSALMRKLLEGIFVEQGDFDIRLARNGAEALALVKSFDPDVVTLDVQMPEMDGLSCLGRIMVEAPRPVVMVSSLTEQGAVATLEAMDLGAIDFMPKPGGAISLEMDRLGPVLIEKVRCAAKVRISKTLRLRERIRHQFKTASGAPRLTRPAQPGRVSNGEPAPGLVLIGTSTGGPAALDVVLPELPSDFGWPVLVAQHMPASFTGPFAKRLDRICPLQVVEVTRAMPLQPGVVYIGRGDADLVVSSRGSGLVAMPVPVRRDYPWHPSVERMILSALDHFDARRLVAVLLTGMGDDGSEAARRVRAEGGHTLAEAESTAVVWGMPGELVKRGGAEQIRPIEDISATIIDWVSADAPR